MRRWDLALYEPGKENDGRLSLSLSPSEGERVPKAGEGLVHGPETWQEAVEASPLFLSKPPVVSSVWIC
jgi:hypothetical protein